MPSDPRIYTFSTDVSYTTVIMQVERVRTCTYSKAWDEATCVYDRVRVFTRELLKPVDAAVRL